jgi:serine protease AprX
LLQKDRVMNRRWLAGALTALVCLFGGTASAAAASGSGKQIDPKSVVTGQGTPVYPGRKSGDHPKLDRTLNDRANAGGLNRSRVIVMLQPGCSVDGQLAALGGTKGRSFGIISGHAAVLPNFVLRKLADNPCVTAIHDDRTIKAHMNRAAVVEGARAVQQMYGYDGAGVGVAIIDSGVTSWHDDLTYQGQNLNVQVVNGQRVVQFVDFVNGLTAPYDDHGHGSHVAGIIAGNGYDTQGARAGMAPGADIVSLKVLDANGGGNISNVIAALDWVVANQALYNIRVINLSIGAAVTESYTTDPLTLAAKRVVDAGVVVVTAAGNFGTNSTTGKLQYGAITAPGNAPWVLTVGAYSHEGTITRADDQMASFSSHGPTAVDYGAKPDVVATGVGIVSLSVPGSTLYADYPQFLLPGSTSNGTTPYLSLTGTSMAAPMVTGTVALMMQANPSLTPNLAKAIIEYTAQNYGYDPLTQGAGFLNTKGAVDLARYLYNAQPGMRYPANTAWSKTILWGNRKAIKGVILPGGSAWSLSTVWGSSSDATGDNIVWGTDCGDANCDNIVWGTADTTGGNIVWGTTASGTTDNIVWGSACNVECDNVVWGSECGDADCNNIVWGSDVAELTADNIVWGSAAMTSDNIVWGSSVDGSVDNIVWGSADDSTGDNIVWGSSIDSANTVFTDPAAPGTSDGTFELDGSYVVPPDGSLPPAPAAPASTTTTPPPAIDPTASGSSALTATAPATTSAATTTTAALTTTTGGL